MLNIVSLLLALGCAAVLYTLFRRLQLALKERQHGCKSPPRYSHKEPVLGLDLFLKLNDARIRNRFLPAWIDLYQTYGQTFQINNMGRRTICTIDPDNLRTIFTTSPSLFGVGPIRLNAMKHFTGAGILAADGDLWKRSRRLILPSFTKRAVSDYSVLESWAGPAVESVPLSKPFDAEPMLNSLLIDSSTEFLFGESISRTSAGVSSHEVSKQFREAMIGTGKGVALGPFYRLAWTRSWLAACQKTRSYARIYVDRVLASLPKHTHSGEPAKQDSEVKRNLLSDMVTSCQDEEHLMNTLLHVFMASQATTSGLISSAIFEVARRPHMWKKLRQEVAQHVSLTELPTTAQLDRLTYMRAVLQESLRLYSTLPMVARAALQDTTLPRGGGKDGKSPIFLRAGDTISISLSALHRNPTVFGSDHAEFRPERWLSPSSASTTSTTSSIDVEPELQTAPPYTFLPFGIGARQCVGRYKAVLEASYIFVRLLQRFESCSSKDDQPWEGIFAITTHNAHRCHVQFD